MEITIVFWGLMALVPQVGDDGWTGMHFLMVRGPEGHRHSVLIERVVRTPFGRYLEPVKGNLSGCQLSLILERPRPEEFAPKSVSPVPGRKPRNLGEGMDLAWLPKMTEVAADDRASLSAKCLNGSECSHVHGRFDVNHGSLRTCHLLHFEGPVARCGTPKRSDRFVPFDHVMEFEYRLPDSDRPHSEIRRAMADAVSWSVRADKATLTWSDFGDSDCAPGRYALEGRSSVVLLVSNLALDATHQHFQSFFDLAVVTTPPKGRPFPVCAGHGRWQSPGSCEGILSLWGDHVGFEEEPDENMYVQPHNRTECDMVLFEPP